MEGYPEVLTKPMCRGITVAACSAISAGVLWAAALPDGLRVLEPAATKATLLTLLVVLGVVFPLVAALSRQQHLRFSATVFAAAAMTNAVVLKQRTALRKRRQPCVMPRNSKHIERHERGRELPHQRRQRSLGRDQAPLKRIEIQPAPGPDDRLTIDNTPTWDLLRGRRQKIREVPAKVFALTGPQRHPAGFPPDRPLGNRPI